MTLFLRIASLRFRQIVMFWRFLIGWTAFIVLAGAAASLLRFSSPWNPRTSVHRTTPVFTPMSSMVVAPAVTYTPQSLAIHTHTTPTTIVGSSRLTTPASSTILGATTRIPFSFTKNTTTTLIDITSITSTTTSLTSFITLEATNHTPTSFTKSTTDITTITSATASPISDTTTPTTTLFTSNTTTTTSHIPTATPSPSEDAKMLEWGKVTVDASSSSGEQEGTDPADPSLLSPEDRAALLRRRCQEHDLLLQQKYGTSRSTKAVGSGEGEDGALTSRLPPLLTQLSLVLQPENDAFVCSVPQVWSPAWIGLLRALEVPPSDTTGGGPWEGMVHSTSTLPPETEEPLLTLLSVEEDLKSRILRRWRGFMFTRSPWDRLVSAYLEAKDSLSRVRSLCDDPRVTKRFPRGTPTLNTRGAPRHPPGANNSPETSTKRHPRSTKPPPEATKHSPGTTMRPVGLTRSSPGFRRRLGNAVSPPGRTDPQTTTLGNEPYCTVYEIQKLSIEIDRDSSICASSQGLDCRLPSHLDFDEFLAQMVEPEPVSSTIASANITINVTNVGTGVPLTTLSHICQPCQIDYTFVGEYDTLEDDIVRFLQVLGRQDLIGSVDVSGKDAENFVAYRKTLLERAEPLLLKKFAQLFAEDFFLFGYDPNPTKGS